jgi:monoamine oxidase
VHNGARRLAGGMTRLINAIAQELPAESLHLGHVLKGVRDAGDHVVISFAVGDRAEEIAARRIVIAVPPRLLEERVSFEPALDAATREAMREAATWMATQAKVVATYERPFWREAGQSGNAFVSHEQAVVGEIFDACDPASTFGALGGFLALSPELRQSFAVGLPILMASQMVQVFGAELDDGEQNYCDWATEPYTCSALDRTSVATEHTGLANPLLRRALWDGKLYLGGSETAAYGAGYLEGALDAAKRVDRLLTSTDTRLDAIDATDLNAASLARFSAWVGTQTEAAFDDYYHRVHRSLSTQQREQLTQRAMLEAVEDVYRQALGILDDLPFDATTVPVERGRSALTPEVQKPFGDFLQKLLDDVIAFNRTSCALSNFPDEHNLSKEYVQTILRDVAAAWKAFSLSANELLLTKSGSGIQGRPQDGINVEQRS